MLVSQSQEVVFMVDSAGRLGYVNPAFERLTGYSAQEALGKNMSSITGEQVNPEAHRLIREQVLQRGIYRGSLEVCGKDGRTFELDLAITGVRDHNARTAGLVCTGRDMTNLSGSWKLSSATPEEWIRWGYWLAGFADDCNNLLMVISAHAELALHSACPEDPLRRSLQEILGASRRAAELTRQLLAFGRKQVQGFQLLSINSLVERTCQMLPKVIGEDVELRLTLGADVGQVRADEGEIEQVLLNLAVNARDAMPNGGEGLVCFGLLGKRGAAKRPYGPDWSFLQKPFSLQVLALKIRAILEEPKVARAAAGRG